MSQRNLVMVLIAFWAITFVGGFAAFILTPSDDFGLAAGWNRVEVFMRWEFVALAAAILSAILSRGLERGTRLRRLGWVPLIGFAVGVVVLAAISVYAINADRTEPDPPLDAKPAVPAGEG